MFAVKKVDKKKKAEPEKSKKVAKKEEKAVVAKKGMIAGKAYNSILYQGVPPL